MAIHRPHIGHRGSIIEKATTHTSAQGHTSGPHTDGSKIKPLSHRFAGTAAPATLASQKA